MKCDDKNAAKTRKQYTLRILHFVSSLSVNSGVMAVIMNYYRHIDRDKIQFDFLYFKEFPTNTTYMREIEYLGGRTYLMEQPAHIFHYICKLCKFFKEHKSEYTILHIHEVYLTFLLAPIAHAHGLKVITHCHSTKFSDKPLNAIRNRLACIGISNHADLRFACSKAAGIALYGKSADFTVINNAIDLDKFAFNSAKRAQLRNELSLEDKVVLGHVGRFDEQKNHNFLINIFYEVQKTLPNSVLLLIGEGPLMKSVKEYVTSLGLQDKVIFLGRRADVGDLYNVMDIFCLPSLFEGLPVVVVEAQANGLPCLLSDAITCEVAIVNVIFASLSSSPSEWNDKMLKLLIAKRCAADLTKLSIRGFDITVESQKLEHMYCNICRII